MLSEYASNFNLRSSKIHKEKVMARRIDLYQRIRPQVRIVSYTRLLSPTNKHEEFCVACEACLRGRSVWFGLDPLWITSNRKKNPLFRSEEQKAPSLKGSTRTSKLLPSLVVRPTGHWRIAQCLDNSLPHIHYRDKLFVAVSSSSSSSSSKSQESDCQRCQ